MRYFLIALFLAGASAVAGPPKPTTAPYDQAAVDAAELKLLRKKLEAQAKEIESIKASLPATQPATREAESTPADPGAQADFNLKVAAARYQGEIIKAQAAYDEAMKTAADDKSRILDAAVKEYVASLKSVLLEETKAGNLDKALEIRDTIRTLEPETAPPSDPAPQGTNTVVTPQTFAGVPMTVGGGRDIVFGPPHRIIYICDVSGSMMQKFDPLRVMLKKALKDLRPYQSFNLVFFQETTAASVDKHLLPVSDENIRKANDFMDRFTPRGSTDPIPGLRAAFAMHPDLVYLLTDGDFPDNKGVIDECHRLNAGGSVKINTIAFLDRGEEYEKVLKQIATKNGGVFRYVSEADLGQ